MEVTTQPTVPQPVSLVHNLKLESVLQLVTVQWLWLSWQSGNFQFKRSTAQIQSSVKFYNEHIYCQLLKRRK